MENISVALLCTLLGFIISLLTFQRNNRKDIEEKERRAVETRTQLEYIQRGIDDIKFNDRLRDDQLKAMNERLIIVEEETKVLFRRLERLDACCNVGDNLEDKGVKK